MCVCVGGCACVCVCVFVCGETRGGNRKFVSLLMLHIYGVVDRW
jgi:hypothetical protein